MRNPETNNAHGTACVPTYLLDLVLQYTLETLKFLEKSGAYTAVADRVYAVYHKCQISMAWYLLVGSSYFPRCTYH